MAAIMFVSVPVSGNEKPSRLGAVVVGAVVGESTETPVGVGMHAGVDAG